MSESQQSPRVPAAPALNADPEKAAIPAGHSDTTSNNNRVEAEEQGSKRRLRHSAVTIPLSARAPDNPRQPDDLSSTSLTMKTSRLQHALIDAQHLRSSGIGAANLDETPLVVLPPRANLEQVYNRIRAEPVADSSFPSSNDLLLARKATQLALAKMRVIAMDFPSRERLVAALASEVPHSFANPLKRLEKDVRCWYSFGKIVGKGTFGRVYSAQHRLSGTQVAIKSYFRETGAAVCCRPPISSVSARATSKQQPSRPPAPVSKHHNGDNSSDALDWKRVRQEVKMMSALSPHTSIVQFIEAFETPTQMHVVMEFVRGETLCDYMRRTNPTSLRLSEVKAHGIFTQLCAAVSSLHDQNMIHRDLKLENVLLDRRGRAKVIDFGFSQFDYSSSGARSSGLASGSDASAKNFCGTPSYMAPEVVSCKSYDGKRVDAWSLGVILYVLLCGKFPFQGQSFHQLYQSIRSSSVSASQFPFPAGVSKDAQSLIRSVLVVDPTKRPRVRDILTHPWMTVTIGATKCDGQPSEPEDTGVEKTPGAIGGRDQRFFSAFLQWEEAQMLFCEALEQISGLSGAELKLTVHEKRRNGVTAFIRLMLLTAERNCVVLADARAQAENNNSSVNNTVEPTELRSSGPDTSTGPGGTAHKQHLEKLIGLVKASLTV